MNILPDANEKPVSLIHWISVAHRSEETSVPSQSNHLASNKGNGWGLGDIFFFCTQTSYALPVRQRKPHKAFGIWLIRRDFALHPSRVPSCTKIYLAVNGPRLACTQLQCASPKPSNHSDSHAVSDPSLIGALEATPVWALPPLARSLPPGSSPSNAHLPEMTPSPIYSLSIPWPQSSSV